MTIKYRMTQADLVHAAREGEGPYAAAARYVMASVLVASGAFLAYCGQAWWAIGFVSVGLLEAFNLLSASALSAVLAFRLNPKFREEYELTLTSESLHFHTETIDSTLKWSHYSRFLETPKAFILIYGRRMFTVIPKRALVSDAHIQETRQLLSAAIAPPKGVV